VNVVLHCIHCTDAEQIFGKGRTMKFNDVRPGQHVRVFVTKAIANQGWFKRGDITEHTKHCAFKVEKVTKAGMVMVKSTINPRISYSVPADNLELVDKHWTIVRNMM